MPLFDIFPTLETERLLLTAVGMEHASGLFALVTDEKVTRYFNVFPAREEADMQHVVERMKNMYAAGAGIRWSVCIKETGAFAGTIGYYNIADKHKATLAYALLPAHWNKGYISEALLAVLDIGFNVMGVERIDAEIRPGNTPSENVLRKMGFTHEGFLKNWVLWNGQLQDMNMYALQREQWLNNREQ